MADSNLNDNKSIKSPPVILMPLPDHDFDVTEVSIPWKYCHSRGWEVIFSTENGNMAEGDQKKLTGPLPGVITAGAEARTAYQQMQKESSYRHPITYAEIEPERYQALLLPGGDALRMRQYLDNSLLQGQVLRFWQQGKLIGAICHGILILARTIDPQTGHSVLYGSRLTVLPGSLDKLAYQLDAKLTKHGYVMYPQCVEDEVRASIGPSGTIEKGHGVFNPFAITDKNLITSRSYMDASLFAETFVNELQRRMDERVGSSN